MKKRVIAVLTIVFLITAILLHDNNATAGQRVMLTYVMDGNTVVTQEIEIGATASVPSISAPEGYFISGYQLSDGSAISSDTVYTQDTTIYVLLEPYSQTVAKEVATPTPTVTEVPQVTQEPVPTTTEEAEGVPTPTITEEQNAQEGEVTPTITVTPITEETPVPTVTETPNDGDITESVTITAYFVPDSFCEATLTLADYTESIVIHANEQGVIALPLIVAPSGLMITGYVDVNGNPINGETVFLTDADIYAQYAPAQATVAPTQEPELSPTPEVTPMPDETEKPSVFVTIRYAGPVESNGQTFYDYTDAYVHVCEVKEDGTVEFPVIESYNGMTFVGLVDENGNFVTSETAFTEDATLYAVYDYTVTTLDENTVGNYVGTITDDNSGYWVDYHLRNDSIPYVYSYDENKTVAVAVENLTTLDYTGNISVEWNETGFIVSFPMDKSYDQYATVSYTTADGTETVKEFFINPVLVMTQLSDTTVTVGGFPCTQKYNGKAAMSLFPTEYYIGDTYYGRTLKINFASSSTITRNMEKLVINNMDSDCFFYPSYDSMLTYFDIANTKINFSSSTISMNKLTYLALPNYSSMHPYMICQNMGKLSVLGIVDGATYLPYYSNMFTDATNPVDLVMPDSVTSLSSTAAQSGIARYGSYGQTPSSIGYNKGIHSFVFGDSFSDNIPTASFACREIELVDLSAADITQLGVSSKGNAFTQCIIGTLRLPRTLTTLIGNDFNGAKVGNADFSSLNIGTVEAYAFCNSTFGTVDLSGSSFTTLPDYAFAGATIDKLILPDTLTTIEENAFAGAKIDTLVLPNSLNGTVIALRTLSYVRAIEHTDGPVSGQAVFMNFPSGAGTESISFPLNTVGIDQFLSQSTTLKTLVIPEGVSYVTNSFHSCTALEDLVVQNVVTVSNAFNNCKMSGDLTVDGIDALTACFNISGNSAVTNVDGNVTLRNLPDITDSFSMMNGKGNLTMQNIGDIRVNGFFSGASLNNVTIENVGDISASALSGMTLTGDFTITNVGNIAQALSGMNVAGNLTVNGAGELTNSFYTVVCNGDMSLSGIERISSGFSGCRCGGSLTIADTTTIENNTFQSVSVSSQVCLSRVDKVGANGFIGIQNCQTVVLEDVGMIGDKAFMSSGSITDISVLGNTTQIAKDVFAVSAPHPVQTTLQLDGSYVKSLYFTDDSDSFSWHTLNRTYEKVLSSPSDKSVFEEEEAEFTATTTIDGGVWQWYKAEPLTEDAEFVLSNSAQTGISTFGADPYMTQNGNVYTFTIPAATSDTLYYTLGVNGNELLGNVEVDVQGTFLSSADKVSLTLGSDMVANLGVRTYQIGSVTPLMIKISANNPTSDVTVVLTVEQKEMYQLTEIDGAQTRNYAISQVSSAQDNTLYCCSYGTNRLSELDVNNPYYMEFSSPAKLTVHKKPSPTPTPTSTPTPTTAPAQGATPTVAVSPTMSATPTPKEVLSTLSVTPVGVSVSPSQVPEIQDSMTSKEPTVSATPGGEVAGGNRSGVDTADHSHREIYLIMLIAGIIGLWIYGKKKPHEPEE